MNENDRRPGDVRILGITIRAATRVRILGSLFTLHGLFLLVDSKFWEELFGWWKVVLPVNQTLEHAMTAIDPQSESDSLLPPFRRESTHFKPRSSRRHRRNQSEEPMSRSTVTAVRLGILAGSLLVALPIMAQQESEPTGDITARTRELQTQRVETLKTLHRLGRSAYPAAECFLHEVLATQHDLLEAELEMAETSDKLIALLELHIKWAKEMVETAEKVSASARKLRDWRGRDGRVRSAEWAEREIDHLQAKTAWLEIEIRLLRERAKANPGKTAEMSDQLIGLLESQFKFAKQKVQVATDLVERKDVFRMVLLRETAALLEIEIDLLRERAKLKSTPK